jgi:hypothetical protein
MVITRHNPLRPDHEEKRVPGLMLMVCDTGISSDRTWLQTQETAFVPLAA